MPSANESRTTAEGNYQPVERPAKSAGPAKAVSVCLVGGKRIFRSAIQKLLDGPEIEISCDFRDVDAFAQANDTGQAGTFDLILMILAAGGFGSFHRFSDTVLRKKDSPPVVVLSDDLSRGGVYSAIRMGAKGYVTLDSAPEELRHAIMLAVGGKMHLSRDAADLMISELTAGARGRSTAGPAGAQLSARETEVVHLLCEGLSSRQIAARLHVSPKTIENHRYNIYRKCQVDSIAGLIRHAVQHGIVTL